MSNVYLEEKSIETYNCSNKAYITKYPFTHILAHFLWKIDHPTTHTKHTTHNEIHQI